MLPELLDRSPEELFGLREPARVLSDVAKPREQPASRTIARAGEFERVPVVALRPLDVERVRPVPGELEEASRKRLELLDLVDRAKDPRELEALDVMVRHELGVIDDPVTGEALDPFGRRAVLVRPPAPRDLAVGDVSDEHVEEGVLRFVLHRGATLAADELLEGVEPLVERRGLGQVAEGCRGGRPEDLADHRRVLQERFFRRHQSVEPRGDDSLDRLGQRQVLAVTALCEHANVLLRVERVAAGAREQDRLLLGGEHRPPE